MVGNVSVCGRAGLGGNVEIPSLSELYDRPIQLFAYSDEPMKTFNLVLVDPQQHHLTMLSTKVGKCEQDKIDQALTLRGAVKLSTISMVS